jgi:predicted nucleic acid-binding protein
MRRIVVCDTGPLIHLGEAKILHLLQLAGEVIIPPAVAKEFEGSGTRIKLPDWITVKAVDKPHEEMVLAWKNHIDEGECAAIALTMQLKADWLLSDDAKARQFGETLGLEIHGSIGLLLWAIAAGHVASHSDALQMLNSLAGSSLWVSDRVITEARKTINELYSVD